MMKVDGLDKAIIGIGMRCGSDDVLIYDYKKCIKQFMDQNNWSYEEAVEWMDFNVVGAYVGETTPIFVREIEEEDEIYPVSYDLLKQEKENGRTTS
tara:strand:- start:65 stop:352 length:288 start_codon:yes stop_codon:yes gene_type:complete